MLTREQAIDAYRRAAALCDRRHEMLRQTILIPVFGGCDCRRHNCANNWDRGYIETADPREHQRQAKLAKRYAHLERQNYETCRRLQAHFAQYF